MVILGIDPGSLNAGYAYIEVQARQLRVLEYGVIKCPSKDPLPKRIQHLCRSLRTLNNDYQPKVFSMEGVFFSKNARSALVLGQARGALMATCMEQDLLYKEYAPKEVKQYAVGRGTASKEQVAWMMMQHFQLKQVPKPHDASDALAVAWACHHDPEVTRLYHKLTKKEAL